MEELQKIKNEMKQKGWDWLILFSADPHLNENVCDFFNHRKKILGFEGSAGVLIISKEECYFRTDSRYFLQCERLFYNQPITLVKEGTQETLSLPQWIEQHLQLGEDLAINQESISHTLYQEIQEACQNKKINLQDTQYNLSQQFQPQKESLEIVEKNYTQRFQEKISQIRDMLTADAILITAPDTIAWLTGYRNFQGEGEEVYFYSWCWITATQTIIFTDNPMENPPEGLQTRPYQSFWPFLAQVENKTIQTQLNQLNQKLYSQLTQQKNKIEEINHKIRILQALKTPEEIASMKKAAALEANALNQFKQWLKIKVEKGEKIKEIQASAQLERFRQQQKAYRKPSFETIMAFGANAAVVHYHPPRKEAEAAEKDIIEGEGVLLLDCGIHSLYGTTDMTRVFWVGTQTPPPQVVRDTTAVLKAHIALARTHFPQGSCGAALDAIAREEGRRGGVEYGHGTGHGVGWINCVHEGPFSLSPSNTTVEALPGMVVSIEPGCYKKDQYGIRLENLYAIAQDEKGLLYFDPITCYPFDSRLIDQGLLTEEEKNWLKTNGGLEP